MTTQCNLWVRIAGIMLSLLVSYGLRSTGATAAPVAKGGMTRVQAIAVVRSLLNKNKAACKINRIQSIAAVRSGGAWRVTARLVMSASGRSLSETAVWQVRADGAAVPANQLTAEITNGCP